MSTKRRDDGSVPYPEDYNWKPTRSIVGMNSSDSNESDSSTDEEFDEEQFSDSEDVKSQYSDAPHTSDYIPKPYKCRYCFSAFRVSSKLLIHEREHQMNRPYRCRWPGCKRSAVEKFPLVKHIRVDHFKVAATLRQQREEGNVDDRDPNGFIKRVDRVHSRRGASAKRGHVMAAPKAKSKIEEHPSKQFPCFFKQYGLCDATFTELSNRRRHERVHLCIKPFRCTWEGCEYRSEQWSSVNSHVRSVHFGLPVTLKKQRELGIIDDRDSHVFIEKQKDLLVF